MTETSVFVNLQDRLDACPTDVLINKKYLMTGEMKKLFQTYNMSQVDP